LTYSQCYLKSQPYGLPKTLTEMQMKFAYELVSNEGRKTKTECAIDAGYSKDAARVMASKLTSPKHIH
jgi:phage terminase small subunit